MEEPAAPRRFPPVSFSLFFPQLFIFSFVGVLVMLALLLSFGTRVPFWRMANMATPSGGMWNQTFSVAGLNTTVSQDGLRCNPVFLWPRTAENAGAATSEFFISTHSTGYLSGRIWIPKWGSLLLASERACMAAPLCRGKWGGVWRGDGGQACLRRAKDLWQRSGGRDEC